MLRDEILTGHNSVVMESIYAFVQKVIQGVTILVVISTVTPPFLLAVGPISKRGMIFC